jgi:uncharacterized protein (TIRG00374 family)
VTDREGQDHRPVAQGADEQVASDAMETTLGLPAAGDVAPAGGDEASAGAVPLGTRLRQPRTILSIVVPLVLVVLIFRVALNVDVAELIDGVARANKLYLLAAFVVFYLGFPLRGLRWATLLRGIGLPIRVKDATEILFISWLVNCLVPAKLGDVYRAWLLKINIPISLSKTFGTVFIERVLDLFVIASLGIAAGFWSFRNGFPPEIQFVVVLGIGVIVVLAVLLLTLRNFGRRILEALPFPHWLVDLYDKFEEGVFGAVDRRSLPKLLFLTVLIWCTEGLRLWFVIQALGFPDVQIGISGAFFVAFIGSLLTAVPLSPAGLGTVELGVVGVLTLAYGIGPQEAATIVIVDRVISVFSIIVFGSLVYVVSDKRRGGGVRLVTEADPVAA